MPLRGKNIDFAPPDVLLHGVSLKIVFSSALGLRHTIFYENTCRTFGVEDESDAPGLSVLST